MSRGKGLIYKAIEYYKDAFVDFHNLNNDIRYDSFIIKIHIAYTCLFLEFYKKNCIKKTFDKELDDHKLGLETLLNKIGEFDNEWKKSHASSKYGNLHYAIQRRNKIEHYNETIERLNEDERRVFNATFRNFYFFIEKHFNEKIDNMPPVTQLFSYLEENQLKTTGEKLTDTKFLKEYIKNNKIVSPNFYYPETNIAKVYVLYDNSKKSYNNALRVSIEHVPADDAEIFMHSIAQFRKCRYNATTICSMVNQRIGKKVAILLGNSANFKETINELNVIGNGKFHQQRIIMRTNRRTKIVYEDSEDAYSEDLVVLLVEHYSKKNNNGKISIP